MLKVTGDEEFEPIGSAMSYDADVARARLMPLIKRGVFVASLRKIAPVEARRIRGG
jgi:hypothetical protein